VQTKHPAAAPPAATASPEDLAREYNLMAFDALHLSAMRACSHPEHCHQGSGF